MNTIESFIEYERDGTYSGINANRRLSDETRKTHRWQIAENMSRITLCPFISETKIASARPTPRECAFQTTLRGRNPRGKKAVHARRHSRGRERVFRSDGFSWGVPAEPPRNRFSDLPSRSDIKNDRRSRTGVTSH